MQLGLHRLEPHRIIHASVLMIVEMLNGTDRHMSKTNLTGQLWTRTKHQSTEGHIFMTSGKIKTLVPAKGFGFITTDGKTFSDLFFHSSSVTAGNFDSLQIGQSVTFEEESDPRDPSRLRAKNVRLAGGGLYS